LTEALVFGGILQHAVDCGAHRSGRGAGRFRRAMPAAHAAELRLVPGVLAARPPSRTVSILSEPLRRHDASRLPALVLLRDIVQHDPMAIGQSSMQRIVLRPTARLDPEVSELGRLNGFLPPLIIASIIRRPLRRGQR
jgi:hypothetical protein